MLTGVLFVILNSLNLNNHRSGSIDVWELRQVLEAMGQQPTEEELFQMISEVDDDMSGAIGRSQCSQNRCFSFGDANEANNSYLSYRFC